MMRSKNGGYDVKNMLLFSIVLLAAGCVAPGAVSPDAVSTRVGVVEDNFDNLKKIVDQKVDNKVFADTIGEVKNETSLLSSRVNAENIKYSGAGYVVVGGALIALLFLAVPITVIWILIKNADKLKSMLTLVTTAVSKSSKDAQAEVKENVKETVKDPSNKLSTKDKFNLSEFAKTNGTYANGE